MPSLVTFFVLALCAATALAWQPSYNPYTGLRPSRKALVPSYGAWENITSPEHHAFRRAVKRDADCTNLGNQIGDFCGDLCPCAPNDPYTNEPMYCNAGKCLATKPADYVTCTTKDDCSGGQDCGYPENPPADYNGPLVCGGKYGTCTSQSQCAGKYVCVDTQYWSVERGVDDSGNCDGADAGQALICDKSDPDADSFCQNNDRLWNRGCGGVRNGSPLPGVCNGAGVACTMATPDAHTDFDTNCFWGYCVNRPDISDTPYCTWKPGPCTAATETEDCDNGLKCGETGQCGGPGAICDDSNGCGDPYPCQIEPTGDASFCRDIDANNGGTSPAVPYDQNAGVGTMCSSTSNADCAGQGPSSCGRTLDGSTDPGVCGGAGASCSSDKQCATGACRGYQCIEWQAVQDLPTDAVCQYSINCKGDSVCVDDGTGTARCRGARTLRARLCEYGGVASCDQDPNYSFCGASRGASEPGVCGGQGAYCFDDSYCFEGTCSGNYCVWSAASPMATTTLNRRRLAAAVCPMGSSRCPTGQTGGVSSGYECIDIMSTLDSCGGCLYGDDASGQDCTDIDHAADVACVYGRCHINSCDPGWKPTGNGTACVPARLKSRRS